MIVIFCNGGYPKGIHPLLLEYIKMLLSFLFLFFYLGILLYAFRFYTMTNFLAS